MPRQVTHDARGPLRLDESDLDPEYGDVAVCLCGLSDDYPFCDGSHRVTEDEDAETTYEYANGERRVVEQVVYANEDGEQ